MHVSDLRRSFSRLLLIPAILALLTCCISQPAFAQTSNHVVSSQMLQKRMQTQSSARKKNINTLTKFFSSPVAQRAMKMQHVSPKQIKDAIPTLSNSELASLSSRAHRAQQQFAAGVLSTNQMLLLIIVLLIVVILVAVH